MQHTKRGFEIMNVMRILKGRVDIIVHYIFVITMCVSWSFDARREWNSFCWYSLEAMAHWKMLRVHYEYFEIIYEYSFLIATSCRLITTLDKLFSLFMQIERLKRWIVYIYNPYFYMNVWITIASLHGKRE